MSAVINDKLRVHVQAARALAVDPFRSENPTRLTKRGAVDILAAQPQPVEAGRGDRQNPILASVYLCTSIEAYSADDRTG